LNGCLSLKDLTACLKAFLTQALQRTGAILPTRAREFLLSGLLLIAGSICGLLILEFALRLFPVNEGLMAAKVDANDPTFHFVPNRNIVWSKHWNFSIVNSVRINNAGYVNDQTYLEKDARPLFAVVGDSIVEADMVPYRDTLHAKIASALGNERRVYSFAGDGAPLSQYLIWAKEAKYKWHAEALAIVVVGNDFDESLVGYKPAPGFHLYARDNAGKLSLRRFDYEPNPWRGFIARSALARYLALNLELRARWETSFATSRRGGEVTSAFAGGAEGSYSEVSHVADGKDVIAAFLRDLTAVAGWQPEEVVFVVDGFRYPEQSAGAQQSYFARMRAYFLDAAPHAGFEAIDMDRIFFAEHLRTGARFEVPTDTHWNGVAHGLAADAVRASATLRRWLARNPSITSQKELQGPGLAKAGLLR
jgi:hypothetical protein